MKENRFIDGSLVRNLGHSSEIGLDIESQYADRFTLVRETDQRGVSGTGDVGRGFILPSGRVVFEWREPRTTLGLYSSLKEFCEIHVDCHLDKTWIEWR